MLGSASTFSVLAAGTGVTGNGTSNLSRSLGITAGAITGFPPGVVGGTIHDKDATATAAQNDWVAAYDDLNARTAHREFDGVLGGKTFHAGISHSTAALDLTGTVTLDAENNADAIFIFQGDAAMNSAAGGTVLLTNGAQASNVYWQVQGAVGAGASSVLAGTILTSYPITLGDLTTLAGRALTSGAITLANNTVSTD